MAVAGLYERRNSLNQNPAVPALRGKLPPPLQNAQTNPPSKALEGTAGPPPSGIPQLRLLEQLQHSLLIGVGLCQGGDARLFQDLVLGHVRHHLAHIRILDAAQ